MVVDDDGGGNWYGQNQKGGWKSWLSFDLNLGEKLKLFEREGRGWERRDHR